MARVCIGLGSNEGDRPALVEAALAAIDGRPDCRVLAVSPLVETEAQGGPAGQGAFLNGAAVVETSLEPLEVLDVLQDIERQLGRVRDVRWQSRRIDLDILLYDEIGRASCRERV